MFATNDQDASNRGGGGGRRSSKMNKDVMLKKWSASWGRPDLMGQFQA